MRITRLLLKNVKCYKTLDLTFRNIDNDEIRNRTIILGNNGTGKSTILKAIALGLSGSSALGELIGKPDKWIKNGCKSGKIEIHLETAKKELRKVILEFNRGDNLSKLMSRNRESLNQLDDALEHTERNYLNIGYGVHRKIGNKKFGSSNGDFENFRANNVATLFDENSSLFPFESWIMDIDYRTNSKGLAGIKKALNLLLPESKFYKIDKETRSIKFKNKDGIVDFEDLSDGFKITANWLGDLLFRITETFENYKNPLKARFILLIDEVALHLHPAWQRQIIQSISNLFPNAQIITTTHSPFVAQQAGDGELFTIVRDKKNNLDLFHYENDPRKLLIHQIIMSDIFGIVTDESVAVENMKNEYRKDSLRPFEETFLETKSTDISSKAMTALNELKNVDSLSDIPVNLYSHEKGGLNFKTMINDLKDEIKKIQDDTTNTDS